MKKKDIISTILNYESKYYLGLRMAQEETGLESKETHIALEIRFLLLDIIKELGLKEGETTVTKKDIISTVINYEHKCWVGLRKVEKETGIMSVLSEIARSKWFLLSNLTEELGLTYMLDRCDFT